MCRIIVFFVQVMQSYFQFVLDNLEMQETFFLIFYLILVFQDFKYSDTIYHFAFEDFLLRNEEMIVKYRRIVNQFLEDNLSGIVQYIKMNILGIIRAMASMLPASIRPFVLPFFESLSKYQ